VKVNSPKLPFVWGKTTGNREDKAMADDEVELDWHHLLSSSDGTIDEEVGGHDGRHDGGHVAFTGRPFAPSLSSRNGSGCSSDAIYSSDQSITSVTYEDTEEALEEAGRGSVPPGTRQESPFMGFTNSQPVAHEVHLACE
jgi:hypothetical protein